MRRREVIAALLLGAVAACPVGAQAQQAGRLKRIGILHPSSRAVLTSVGWQAFESGLRELGLVEARDFVFEHRFIEDRERLPEAAAELVGTGVDVIIVRGPVPMLAAKAATTRIPIVMAASSSDPIAEGLIASFARPGGNITGVTYAVSPERLAKQIDILREAVGPISRIAVLWDLDLELYLRWAPSLEQAAGQLGLRILGPFEVRTLDDLDPAFTAMREQGADAVLTSVASVLVSNQRRIADLGLRHRLAIMGAFREFPHAGTLISYGPNIAALNRRVAVYVAKILSGAKPEELPVENPTTYDLVVNLKTAKALGITIPPALLIRADEVIE
jgi:putative ABC transport system substrate-binding protein